MSSKEKSTVTRNNAKSALVPKLRFPEFRDVGEWTKMPLGNAATFYNGRAYKDEELLESGKYPVLRVGNFFTSKTWYYSDLELDKTKYCEYGDLLYAWSASFGPRIWRGEKAIYHYHIWKVAENSGIHRQFLLITLENETEKMKAASANGLGIMHITKGSIEDWGVTLPAMPEQQRIADCLTSLDDLIAAQTQKLDALKTHKKGLMQQLFPREGETQPRLRFPEFQDAGEWNEKPLSEMIELISGVHLSPDDYSSTGEVPYFTGPSDFTNDLHNITKWTKLTANVSQAEDTLITVKGSGVGEVWFSTLLKVAMGRQLMAVRTKHGVSRFIFQFLLTKRSHFVDLGSGNLIPGLARTDILGLRASFPSPPEQQRIADCLTTLDNLIAAQIQKLDALKTHKKGLMQQLFPSLEEVEE